MFLLLIIYDLKCSNKYKIITLKYFVLAHRGAKWKHAGDFFGRRKRCRGLHLSSFHLQTNRNQTLSQNSR
jgi:hypothetical protein